jgi:FixJ family two-component response regulator
MRQIALDSDQSRRKKDQIVAELQARFESLTSRERGVMTLVTMGKMNKRIAIEIGLSEIIVKVYRHNVIKKWARSLWPTWYEWRLRSRVAGNR